MTQLNLLITGCICYIYLRKKDFDYAGNRMMANFMLFMSIDAGSVFVYSLLGLLFSNSTLDLFISVFYRLSLIFFFASMLTLYYTMKILEHSSFWIEKKGNLRLSLIIMFILMGLISFTEFFTVASYNPIEIAFEGLFILIPISTNLLSLYYIMMSLRIIWANGIKKTTGAQLTKLKFFFVGLLVVSISIVVRFIYLFRSTLSLEVAYFTIYFIGVLLIAYGFIAKAKKETSKSPTKKENTESLEQ